jgi:hypothetical protein
VLRFGRLHLDRAAPVGADVAAAMTEFQRRWPSGLSSIDGSPLTGMGLGWFVHDWAETRVFGHDGAGLGCAASLRVVPEQDVAVVCLSNSWYAGYGLNGELLRSVLEEELGLTAPRLVTEPNPHGAERYVGTYRRLASEIEIIELDGGLEARQRQDLLHDSSESATEFELEPVGPDLFRARNPAWALDRTYRFVTTAGTRPDYLYQGIRAHRRDG